METQANTIWTKAYTPAGFQVGITIGFEAGNLPLAVDIDRMITEKGYLLTLPGVEPGEDVEPILYVCRKNHTDTKTGAIVPHIAFYSENDNLTKRWTHTYLDTPEQVAEFENGTGVKVADMPVYDGDLHPDRTKSKAVIKLAKTIKVVRDFYETKDGEPRRPFKRFVDSIGTPPAVTTPAAPSNVTTLPVQPNASGSASTDDAWLPKVYGITEFLYEVKKHQENSINKLIRDGSITSDMKPIVAASHVFMHKANEKLRLSQDDITDQLGKSLGDYLRSGKTLQDAWQDIQPPADALPPTGTDDIPF